MAATDVTPDVEREAVATGALILYSLAVAAGFARVFSGWDFFDNLLVIVVVGHALSFALRLARTPVWAAFPITAAALAWLIAAMFYRETFALFVPTTETWSVFRLELDVVGNQFRSAVAPVAFLGGWNVLAAIGVSAAVLLADTFAFRAFARAEALVPGGVLFVFVAALGSDRSRIASTMLLVGAGVVTTVVLRNHHSPQHTGVIGVRRGLLPMRALPVACCSAAVIALAAGYLGPRLPGAGEAPIYETKGGDDGSVTEVISPLVDIRSRLTNRSTTELFQVTADVDSYWRSSALASFDGRRWGIPSRSLSRTDSDIGQAAEGSVPIRQTIRITNLGGPLLPAAADPTNANGVGEELADQLRYSDESATLVKTGGDLESGDEFEVLSASPRFTAAQLTNATSNDPGDPIYFELPDDFPTSVEQITREVIGDATSTYEIALTLQNWMRSEFTYSLEIQEGHGSNEIESFLRNRVGYCEQFAGTYAAMLRSIGIPSRVSVGFTPGENISDGVYSVLGRNAHAWPEVWFDDFGWVPFEPTPGRGAPFAEDYTGVEQQQDEGPADAADSDGEEAPTTTAPPVTTPSPTTVVNDPTASTVPSAPTPAEPEPTEIEPEVVAIVSDDGLSFPWRPLGLFALLAAALAAPAAIRRVRRSRATSPQAALANLWDRATGALQEVGLTHRATDTPAEVAAATSEVFAVAARPMSSLAEMVTQTTFAAGGSAPLNDVTTYGTTTLHSCQNWCRQVERAVTDSITPAARVRRYFTTLR